MYKIKPYKMCSGNPQSTGYYLEWEIQSKDLNCCTEDTHPLGVQTDKNFWSTLLSTTCCSVWQDKNYLSFHIIFF